MKQKNLNDIIASIDWFRLYNRWLKINGVYEYVHYNIMYYPDFVYTIKKFKNYCSSIQRFATSTSKTNYTDSELLAERWFRNVIGLSNEMPFRFDSQTQKLRGIYRGIIINRWKENARTLIHSLNSKYAT